MERRWVHIHISSTSYSHHLDIILTSSWHHLHIIFTSCPSVSLPTRPQIFRLQNHRAPPLLMSQSSQGEWIIEWWGSRCYVDVDMLSWCQLFLRTPLSPTLCSTSKLLTHTSLLITSHHLDIILTSSWHHLVCRELDSSSLESLSPWSGWGWDDEENDVDVL